MKTDQFLVSVEFESGDTFERQCVWTMIPRVLESIFMESGYDDKHIQMVTIMPDLVSNPTWRDNLPVHSYSGYNRLTAEDPEN